MIAIKNMEMPKSCLECPVLDRQFFECSIIKKYVYGKDIPKDCPLVEIVTCKDCSIGKRECSNSGKYCIHIGKITEDDFYCANGEKEK